MVRVAGSYPSLSTRISSAPSPPGRARLIGVVPSKAPSAIRTTRAPAGRESTAIFTVVAALAGGGGGGVTTGGLAVSGRVATGRAGGLCEVSQYAPPARPAPSTSATTPSPR